MSFRRATLFAVFLALGATAASAGDSMIKISASAKAACMPDAMRLCRDAVPNVYSVLICFGRNRDKISRGCRTVLASYGLQ